MKALEGVLRKTVFDLLHSEEDQEYFLTWDALIDGKASIANNQLYANLLLSGKASVPQRIFPTRKQYVKDHSRFGIVEREYLQKLVEELNESPVGTLLSISLTEEKSRFWVPGTKPLEYVDEGPDECYSGTRCNVIIELKLEP